MFKFYQKVGVVSIALLLLTLLVGGICVDRTFLTAKFLPADKSTFNWRPETWADKDIGGGSTVVIHDAKYSLDFEFKMASALEYPYASMAISILDEHGGELLIDMSRYTRLSFMVRCEPHNILFFAAHMVDEDVTDPEDPSKYRSPSSHFSCEKEWAQVNIDLTRLKTPQWWFDKFGLDLSREAYRLTQVSKISIGATHQSPPDVSSLVKINELTMHGRDWRYMYALAVWVVLVWGGFIFWLFRAHTKALIAELKRKFEKDRPLIAYQQLSMQPQRAKEQSDILRYMTTEYANPELNLDLAVTQLGVSRTKINAILKDEIGYTFSAYLNKLRLTEAARLLTESDRANVAEIAYSVGYNNVSYFNKLFKTEYGCTPKTFKDVYKG